MRRDFPIVKAILKLYSTKNGGRKDPILSGYRPHHIFEYKNGKMREAFQGVIQFEGENLFPGESKEITVRFLPNLTVIRYLKIGRVWYLHEGTSVVGEAKIVDLH